MIDYETAYTAVLGRPALAKFMAATHYAYGCLKIPRPNGVITIATDVKTELLCDKRSLDLAGQRVERKEAEHPRPRVVVKPHGADKLIPLDPAEHTKTIRIGASLSREEEIALVKFLRNNSDVFAWQPSDMPDIPREVVEHRLAVRPDAKPVKQKLRRFAPDRRDAIKAEIEQLLAAGFIREVEHHEWLANPVMVKKANSMWRMCVDFTDLNKAYPKDTFPLPRIDQIVDSTSRCDYLSLLDAYSGYHQVSMCS